MEEIIVTFDDSAKKDIINALGLKEDNGVILDSKSMIITDQNYEELTLKDFGGVLKGSKVFINNDSKDLVSYFASYMI